MAIPVIAIDGPSASGKGTVAERVAQALGFNYLDSGSLYRLVALAAQRAGIDVDDEPGLTRLATQMDIAFRNGRTWLGGEDVSEALRAEAVGIAASRVATVPGVRARLLEVQRGFRKPPGLVGDGRDIGSVIFPDAALKVFLTADVEIRAQRRHKQLMEKGMYAKMPDVVEELRQRDDRDMKRTVAPLKHYPDAVFLDTSAISVDEAVARVLAEWSNRSGK